MTNPIENIPLHPTAKQQIHRLSMKFAERLVLQSKLVASRNDAPAVLSNHVDEAEVLVKKRSDSSRARDTVLVVGSVFLGAFLPGVVEAVQNANILSLVVWMIIAIVGVSITMFGLWGMKE